MPKRILITGGAGFIGSHLTDELLKHGYKVRILDNLSPQVHGGRTTPPDYLNHDAEFVYGDVRDKDAVCDALSGIDAVFHFAAAVGVGQSMYEIEKYTSVNNLGTAVLLQVLLDHPVQKLIVASSMSVYGEGLYRGRNGIVCGVAERPLRQLKQGVWELFDEERNTLTPIPTPESKQPCLASIYALSKYDQECMCLLWGRAYEVPTVALRFFNVYGPRQALSNPYTGVLAIFASRLLSDKPPIIYEDGLQKRDFVSVKDIAKACRLSLASPAAADVVINVGSGMNYTVRQIAAQLSNTLQKQHLAPQINGHYRVGDIRHCFADVGKAHSILGYRPDVSLEAGLAELAEWLSNQVPHDSVDSAHTELAKRGLTL